MVAKHREESDGDALIMGAILAEVIDRRRAGEHPSPADYVERHPRLRKEIEAHFETIELLEGTGPPPASPQPSAPGGPAEDRSPSEGAPRIGELIADLSPLIQRLIYLRNFERKTWEEIARALDRPETELRRGYAQAIRQLIERCGSRV